VQLHVTWLLTCASLEVAVGNSEDDKTMPAKCNLVGTSAVRQDDSPFELHHIYSVAQRPKPHLLSAQ